MLVNIYAVFGIINMGHFIFSTLHLNSILRIVCFTLQIWLSNANRRNKIMINFTA